MNEKFEKLIAEAFFDEVADHADTKVYKLNDAMIQKFAELIVQECMRMCDVAQVGYLTHGHTLQGEGCQGAKRYISDWFEVEE